MGSRSLEYMGKCIVMYELYMLYIYIVNDKIIIIYVYALYSSSFSKLNKPSLTVEYSLRVYMYEHSSIGISVHILILLLGKYITYMHVSSIS